jgi:hypothetical protein
MVERVEVAATNPEPLVRADLRARLESDEVRAARATAFEAVWDLVWRRRVTYFVTVGLTLLLVAMPAWGDRVPKLLLADGRIWIDAPLRALGTLLPGFLSTWIDTFADSPFYFLLLAGLIWACMRYGAGCERRLRDGASHIWQAATDVAGSLPRASEESGLARFRNSTGYQRGMQGLKWLVLPDVVILPLIAFVAVWLAAAGITQIVLPRLESGTGLCRGVAGSLQPLDRYENTFEPKVVCHAVGRTVVKDRRYRVELRVEEAWFDGSHATNPMGLRARDLGPAGILGPFRRVIEANFLQPVVEIRQGSRPWPFDKVHIDPLAVSEQQAGLFAGEFKATQDGELFLFVNDAVWLPEPTYFYQSRPGINSGRARLTIVRLEEAPVAAVRPPSIQAQAGR